MSGLTLPPLYVICDEEACRRAGWTLIDFARACFDGGARLLQLRAKTMAAGALLDAASALVQIASRVNGRVVVNDRADIARLAGAAGVHVGQTDLSPRGARTIVGAGSVVGLSTHTAAQQRAALAEPIAS